MPGKNDRAAECHQPVSLQYKNMGINPEAGISETYRGNKGKQTFFRSLNPNQNRPKGAEKADCIETIGNKSPQFFLSTSDGEVILSKKEN